MEHGTILLWSPDRRHEFEERARRAERLGFAVIGVGDSPNAYRDWSLGAALASSVTERARIGSAVISPHGRHPVATANALSALQELSGGRAFCGIGTGGSAAAATGSAAATLEEVRSYLTALRALLRGEGAEWRGATTPAMTGTRATPLFLSAYGPAAMRLAGAVADGVILAVGASPDLIATFRAEVATGAERAGRSPDEVATWLMTRVAVRARRGEAIDDVKGNLASAGAFGLRSKAQMATVPDEHRSAVVELQRRYDPTRHVMAGGPNSDLVDELGLGEYLARRFGVIGTPQECREQIAAIESAGVSCVLAPAVDRDPDGLLERYASAVLGGREIGLASRDN